MLLHDGSADLVQRLLIVLQPNSYVQANISSLALPWLGRPPKPAIREMLDGVPMNSSLFCRVARERRSQIKVDLGRTSLGASDARPRVGRDASNGSPYRVRDLSRDNHRCPPRVSAPFRPINRESVRSLLGARGPPEATGNNGTALGRLRRFGRSPSLIPHPFSLAIGKTSPLSSHLSQYCALSSESLASLSHIRAKCLYSFGVFTYDLPF